MALDNENKRRAIQYVFARPNNADLDTEDQRRHIMQIYESSSGGGTPMPVSFSLNWSRRRNSRGA